MGLFAERWSENRTERKSIGIGYPNVGWAPYPGAYTSSTGVTVTQDRADTVAAWFAGRRVLAQDVAKLPLIIYRQNGRAKDRAEDHPLYKVLKKRPNPRMTSFVWRETAMGHLIDWGNCYAERELNGLGQTVYLWPLRPDRMTVSFNDAGEVVYEYRVREWSAPTRLSAKRVFHIPGMGFDGLVGYPLLQLARETLGGTIALREYASRTLGNDARPSVIVTHPKTLSDPARKNLEDSWNDRYGGFSNAGRTAILEEGMTVTTLDLPRDDILFLEGSKWQVSEVARWQGLAPHKIGDLEHATFSNIEEQNIDHYSSAIQAWLTRWEQQIDKDLLPEDDVFAEHLMDAALRGRTLERQQSRQIQVQNKVITPNEWRESENMNPVSWGDEPISTPNNSAPAPEPMADVEAEPVGATNGHAPAGVPAGV